MTKPIKARGRARVTNGHLVNADGRTAIARRFRDVLAEIISDLGGLESEAKRQLARRAATLAVQCEQMESDAVMGAPFDIDAYGRAANTMRRLHETLGLERVPKPVESYKEYFAKIEAQQQETPE